MSWWQYVLFPFAVLYDILTRLRNALFDHGIINAIRFDTNVIGVGNLSVGGTGKTPMVNYLVDVFNRLEAPSSILSRGYKRRSSGFRQVKDTDNADTVGDEPYMYHCRYPDTGVFVGSDRVMDIPQLLFLRPETQVILLDDAFQHRFIQPDFQIVLTTFHQPFYRDYLMPSGRLRECRAEAARAHCVIVTKCPDTLTETEQTDIEYKIRCYTSAPVFFTIIQYDEPRSFFDDAFPFQNHQIGISGIADPGPFTSHLDSQYNCRIIHDYPDHYRYQPLDVRHIMNELNEQTSLITTEKDMIKLREFEQLKAYSCYFVPIKVKFLKDEALFLSLMDSHLKKGAYE